MDRVIVYAGAIPQDTDLLNSERNAMLAVGALASALFGATTTANGLACTPTVPAAMKVQVGRGEIYSVGNIDDTAYGALGSDVQHQTVKQGVLLDSVAIACPAPSTPGYSITYLIEAAFSEVDDHQVVLPYYNSSNPAQAFSGPANSGSSQPTMRRGTVVVTAKPGPAAPTGSQTTPAADPGYIGLWVVTVAYGATTIAAGSIAAAPGASIVPAGGLFGAAAGTPAKVQANSFIYANDGGSVNAMAATINPVPMLATGLEVLVKAGVTNTGNVTLNLNGLGAVAVSYAGAAIPAGMIVAGTIYAFVYDGARWQLRAPALHGIVASSLGASGYKLFSDGSLEQWGNGSCGADGSYTVTFPIPFPVACDWAIASNNGSGPPTGFHATQIISQAQVKIWASTSAGVAAGAGTASFWEARGR